MNNDPKFWPIDALNAYPEPVGTLDRLELSGGAVWVHLNGKRAKLVGLQSLAFLIGNLQAIHDDVFASAEPDAPQIEPEKPCLCTSCDNCQGFNTGHDSSQQLPYSISCDNCHKEARAADHSGLAKAWNAVNQAG